MKRYNPKEIEPKWQEAWEEQGIHRASEDPDKPKKYVLEYFPYPSGSAMHVGHVRNYAIGDTIGRHARMRGFNVLHPMGWDAFGLPAENYAIKTGISPKQVIQDSTTKFKQQLMQMGFGYDWTREINSSDPSYYKWTQWLFLLLHKRDLAYQKESPQWWCPVDKTVLANEQVEAGVCWRCGSKVEKKMLEQWFFKITEYADRLDKDLDDVDWSHAIKSMQRNWIGHKTGINITYKVDNLNSDETITCFTTRPDTNYGATFIVLAPEHPFTQKVINQEVKPADGTSHWQAVEHYAQKALSKSELERKEEGRLKTGVFTGLYVTNSLNGRKMPIWVSDFVLAGFGTGAVVGVPGHDMRDYEFAKQFKLPIERVVIGTEGDDSAITKPEQVQEKSGKMINSGPLDGLDIKDAIEKMKDLMEAKNMGQRTHSYSIRDWLISRQRYWGAPIPIIHCPKDGAVPVPLDQLPVVLPEVESYQSTDAGSALEREKDWVNTTCPMCGGPAQRETDTMDGFACSSWYFLRFADPHNDLEAFSSDRTEFWLPVDDYIGGAEHAVMHLLYARFWTKVMYDEGLISFQEPFSKLRNHGMILAPDGRKMSKSKGNTIEPDALISQGYGADSIRLMELFIAPWNQAANWSVEGIGGMFRFLQRVWTISQEFIELESSEISIRMPANEQADLQRTAHATIKKVSKDLDDMQFNTAISALMEAINELYKLKVQYGFSDSESWRSVFVTIVQLLAPFAPHIAEELWHDLDQEGSVHTSPWPVCEEKYLMTDEITIVVQINGKVRANISVAPDASEAQIVKAAKANPRIQEYVLEKEIHKTIYVPQKLVNFVV